MNLLGFLSKLLYPSWCVCCQKFGSIFCEECRQKLEPLVLPIEISLDQDIVVDEVRSIYIYNYPMQRLLHALKYQRLRSIATILGEYVNDALPQWPIDLCTYVPLTQSKKLWRGFNQSELVANQAMSHTRVETREVLSRTRDSARTQAGLDRRDRLAQYTHNPFTANQDLTDKSILLIDDVLTTRSTLNSCASALKQAGAKKVFGLTAAHGT